MFLPSRGVAFIICGLFSTLSLNTFCNAAVSPLNRNSAIPSRTGTHNNSVDVDGILNKVMMDFLQMIKRQKLSTQPTTTLIDRGLPPEAQFLREAGDYVVGKVVTISNHAQTLATSPSPKPFERAVAGKPKLVSSAIPTSELSKNFQSNLSQNSVQTFNTTTSTITKSTQILHVTMRPISNVTGTSNSVSAKGVSTPKSSVLNNINIGLPGNWAPKSITHSTQANSQKALTNLPNDIKVTQKPRSFTLPTIVRTTSTATRMDSRTSTPSLITNRVMKNRPQDVSQNSCSRYLVSSFWILVIIANSLKSFA